MEMCRECRKLVIVVEDHSAGDTICTECGLVLEAHFVDERPEWRTFSDISSYQSDRVGAPSNSKYFLTNGGLTTSISQPAGAPRSSKSSGLLRSQHRLASKVDQPLLAAFKLIATMADRLGLMQTVVDRANDLYKQMDDLQYTHGRSKNGIVGACIFIACRQEDTPRTYKEIVTVANGAKMGTIGQATRDIVKRLEAVDPTYHVKAGAINPADHAKRFCSRLGMDNNEVNTILHTMTTAQTVLPVRSTHPTTILAAIIFMVSQLSAHKKSLRDVATAARVAETTVKSSYQEIYPYADKIIPDWFADRVNLTALPSL